MDILVRKNGADAFSHAIDSVSIGDSLCVLLSGGYCEHGLQKGCLYDVTVNDGQSVITKPCMFLSYQFSVSSYQQASADGTVQTATGVTNNALVFTMLS